MLMKQIPVTIALCGSLLLAGGCGHDHKDHAHSVPEPGHGGHDANVNLELNNGQKWKVDDHTRQSTEKLLHLLDETAPIGSRSDAEALAEALDEELANLVRGCTMTGPAHDQLHVFLAALFPKAAELRSQRTVKELQTVRDEISSLFAAYNEHFE